MVQRDGNVCNIRGNHIVFVKCNRRSVSRIVFGVSIWKESKFESDSEPDADSELGVQAGSDVDPAADSSLKETTYDLSQV
jgi:hypothetical protein